MSRKHPRHNTEKTPYGTSPLVMIHGKPAQSISPRTSRRSMDPSQATGAGDRIQRYKQRNKGLGFVDKTRDDYKVIKNDPESADPESVCEWKLDLDDEDTNNHNHRNDKMVPGYWENHHRVMEGGRIKGDRGVNLEMGSEDYTR